VNRPWRERQGAKHFVRSLPVPDVETWPSGDGLASVDWPACRPALHGRPSGPGSERRTGTGRPPRRRRPGQRWPGRSRPRLAGESPT